LKNREKETKERKESQQNKDTKGGNVRKREKKPRK
jgi:hypothetical protein